MGAGLKLEKLFLERREIDGKGAVWRWSGWKGIREEGIVCLRDLRRLCCGTLRIKWLFDGIGRRRCRLQSA